MDRPPAAARKPRGLSISVALNNAVSTHAWKLQRNARVLTVGADAGKPSWCSGECGMDRRPQLASAGACVGTARLRQHGTKDANAPRAACLH
jgi:hypothetical protein